MVQSTVPLWMFSCVDSPLATIWNIPSAILTSIGMKLGFMTPPELPFEDLTGKVAIVTGSNTGIGKRTAFHLAKMGASVILACRSQERGIAARDCLRRELEGLKGANATGSVELMALDLTDFDSIRDFVDKFLSAHKQLHILVNNAGLNMSPKHKTKFGLDVTFAANYLGHFVLTKLLYKTITDTPNARVVNLASVMHHYAQGCWEKAATQPSGELISSSYVESKCAMMLFSEELRRRFAADHCTATSIAVNPGAVRSEIWRGLPKVIKYPFDLLMRALFLDPDQGSFTSVVAAVAPLDTMGRQSRARLNIQADGAGSSSTDVSPPLYLEPYYLPFGISHPYEVMGPFIGAREAEPSRPKKSPDSADLWKRTEAILSAAEENYKKSS